MEEEITREDIEYFNRSRELAYRGKAGREREEFCIAYIERKKAILEGVRQEIIEKTGEGMKFTCHKGCAFCCVLYIEASVSECEAIACYLYHHIDAFFNFIGHYPDWREKTGRTGDVLMCCVRAWQNLRKYGSSVDDRRELADSLMDYQTLDVPCPFLHNDSCTIYEVRPYACATHYSTSPAVWCSPRYPGEPEIYRARPSADMFDLSLYRRRLRAPVVSSMPLTVYGILSGGLKYISEITGLKGLAAEQPGS